MVEELITFETAQLAEEKGFDIDTIPVLYQKSNGRGIYLRNGYDSGEDAKRYLSRPTQELLKKWLRVKHNIHIQLEFDDNIWFAQIGDFRIPDFAPDQWITLDERESFQESLEAYETIFEMALVVALNKIK